MALDPEQIQELFSEFGRVAVRRMFGGAGIFADGLMIGLISKGDIFLKADDQTIPKFEAQGMSAFSFGMKKRHVITSYWRMPDRLLDDPEELGQWARAALSAAHRAADRRAKSKRLPSRKRFAPAKKARTRSKK